MQESSNLRFSILPSLVGREEFPSALPHDVNGGVPNKLAGGRKIDGQQIPSIRARPKLFELRIPDKHRRRPRRIRTIFEIFSAAIPEQRLTIRVKEHGRE